jgi:hypothetical protein
MPHPHGAREGTYGLKRGVELGQLARSLHDRKTAVDQRNARRVIPPVLEASEPLENDGKRLVGTHVSDDAAHGFRG